MAVSKQGFDIVDVQVEFNSPALSHSWMSLEHIKRCNNKYLAGILGLLTNIQLKRGDKHFTFSSASLLARGSNNLLDG